MHAPTEKEDSCKIWRSSSVVCLGADSPDGSSPGLPGSLPRKGFRQRARGPSPLCESAVAGPVRVAAWCSSKLISLPVMERHSRLLPAWLLGPALLAAYWSNKGQRTSVILGAVGLVSNHIFGALSAVGGLTLSRGALRPSISFPTLLGVRFLFLNAFAQEEIP